VASSASSLSRIKARRARNRAERAARRMAPGGLGSDTGSSSGGSSSSTPAVPGTGSQRGPASRGGRRRQNSGSGSRGQVSWGTSNVWWQPGQVLSCSTCDATNSYTLVSAPDGTSHCGECITAHVGGCAWDEPVGSSRCGMINLAPLDPCLLLLCCS
jgi:hypothetical protein